MKVATIRITDTKKIDFDTGGMSPAELVCALDAIINITCKQATGDAAKALQMKLHCQQQNQQVENSQLILPGNIKA